MADSAPINRPSHRRAWLVAIGLIASGVLLASLAVGVVRDPPQPPSPLLGKPAPDFRLTALDGSTVELAALRGRPVIINFWASWCLPCREEAPLLRRVQEEYRDRGLVVLGVIFEDSPENARAFMERYDQRYPGLLDPDGRTAVDYGVFGIPETYFVRRDGIVTYKQTGAISWEILSREAEVISR